MAFFTEQTEAEPIVMVHGLFGWNDQELFGYPYFRNAVRITTGSSASYYYPDGTAPRLLFPSTGPVSSLHDQACELFYQLKGGRVDYGEAHAAEFCHNRYGRDYVKPLYPEWDSSHPLDFVAHSMGAPVVRMLQYLLKIKYFRCRSGTAYDTSPSWIRSITSVAGVHNGSTLAWILGCSEKDGTLENSANFISLLGTFFTKWQKISEKKPTIRNVYDIQLEHWDIDCRCGVHSLCSSGALDEFFKSQDAAPFDLTPNSMANWNSKLREYPETWYFSYPVYATVPFFSVKLPVYPCMHMFLLYSGFRMGSFVCSPENPFRSMQQQFRDNDGMCPTWSQKKPVLGREPEIDIKRMCPSSSEAKGVWNCMKPIRLRDHADVAMFPRFFSLGRIDRLYKTIFDKIYLLRNVI